MAKRLTIALSIAAALGGCSSRGLPGNVAVKRPMTMHARAADPVVTTEWRLPLAESGYRKLLGAFAWKPQPRRTDDYYDLFDGHAFRWAAGDPPFKLRIKRRPDRIQWQISERVSEQTVTVEGLPITTTATRSMEDTLTPAEAAPLLTRTDAFFLWLDAGGAPLRARAQAVDAVWATFPWAGRAFLPPQAEGDQPLVLVPASLKQRYGQEATLPLEAGGKLTLGLHLDEQRDADGRWVERFEIEAEGAEGQDPAAIANTLGHALAAQGLGPDDLSDLRPDSFAYTLQQLMAPDAAAENATR